MALAVILVLLAALCVVLYYMARSRAPDAHERFLEALLKSIRETQVSAPVRAENYDRNFAGRTHHRHRVGV